MHGISSINLIEMNFIYINMCAIYLDSHVCVCVNPNSFVTISILFILFHVKYNGYFFKSTFFTV